MYMNNTHFLASRHILTHARTRTHTHVQTLQSSFAEAGSGDSSRSSPPSVAPRSGLSGTTDLHGDSGSGSDVLAGQPAPSATIDAYSVDCLADNFDHAGGVVNDRRSSENLRRRRGLPGDGQHLEDSGDAATVSGEATGGAVMENSSTSMISKGMAAAIEDCKSLIERNGGFYSGVIVRMLCTRHTACVRACVCDFRCSVSL